MPSLITHSLVGLAASEIVPIEKADIRFRLACVVCATLPDADVAGFAFGIPYGAFLGHRGFFHSLFFAAILSLALALFFRRRYLFHFGLFFIISASHGLLDALTSGGLGIALFSPFDKVRYFFPATPILVSPIGISSFLTARGLKVLASEAVWVWLPTITLLLLAKAAQNLRPRMPRGV